MEVTMFHPDNKKGKVVVTNDSMRAGFLKQGFVDAPENEQKSANDMVSKTVQEDAREHVKADPLAAETKAQNKAETLKKDEAKSAAESKDAKAVEAANVGEKVEVKHGMVHDSKTPNAKETK